MAIVEQIDKCYEYHLRVQWSLCFDKKPPSKTATIGAKYRKSLVLYIQFMWQYSGKQQIPVE